LSSGRIKFTDEQDVTELVRENYDTEYYADQLAADDVECDLGYTQVIMTFIVTWSDPDISVEDMWYDICGEYNRPQMIDSREVGQ
jgi:hypothetical protein